jgi:hypothetical protein
MHCPVSVESLKYSSVSGAEQGFAVVHVTVFLFADLVWSGAELNACASGEQSLVNFVQWHQLQTYIQQTIPLVCTTEAPMAQQEPDRCLARVSQSPAMPHSSFSSPIQQEHVVGAGAYPADLERCRVY